MPCAFSTPATKSQPTSKPQPNAKHQPAAKPQPAEKSKPTATSKPQQTTHGLGCLDPKTTFFSPMTLGVRVPSLNIQNNLPWVGPHVLAEFQHRQPSPLHLDLPPVTLVSSETSSDLTCPHYNRGVLQLWFDEVFSEMHSVGCMDLQKHSMASPIQGVEVPIHNKCIDLSGWFLVSLQSFIPDCQVTMPTEAPLALGPLA